MKNYREMTGVSQSLLKKLIKGPFFTESDPSSDHFILGTLTEDLYNGKADKYKAVTFPSKTTNLGKFIAAIWQFALDYDRMPDSSERSSIYDVIGIKKPAFSEMDAKAEDFFGTNGNLDPTKHIVVSEDIMDKATNMVDKLIFDYYVKELLSSNSEKTVQTSAVLDAEYEGRIKCKGELDYLIIDNANKTVQIVDLKTTSSYNYSFNSSFWSFRYDIQGAFYYFLVESMLAHSFYEGYTQLNPVFVAVDPWTPHPLIFKMSNDTLDKGKNGYKDHYGNYQPGWVKLMELYEFYESNGYEYPKETVESKGVIMI